MYKKPEPKNRKILGAPHRGQEHSPEISHSERRFTGLIFNHSVLVVRDEVITIDHQLQRTSDMKLIVESTMTSAGTRKLPMMEDVLDEPKRMEELEKARKELNGRVKRILYFNTYRY